jgi:hypothetical protein
VSLADVELPNHVRFTQYVFRMRRCAALGQQHGRLDQVVDAVIVGGHIGLPAAAFLARAGWSVQVLEREDHLCGAVVTEELMAPASPSRRRNVTVLAAVGLLLIAVVTAGRRHTACCWPSLAGRPPHRRFSADGYGQGPP